MNFNNISLPHPVLRSNYDDIASNIALDPAPNITESNNTYHITITCEHDNSDLHELINSEKAEYYCEVTCSHTLYRNFVTSQDKTLSIEIPKKQLKGKVEFSCALLAKSSFTEYQNSNAHDDYTGFRFEIESGDILAFFGKFTFNADIRYEKLKAVSSFMEVVANEDNNVTYTNVNLNKNKIEVQLPLEDYNQFANDSISKEQNFASVFHSSIVLNALLIALYKIEHFRDKLWAKTLEYRLNEENISLDEDNIPEFAQKLLGNPYKRLMEDLHKITVNQHSTINE